MPKRGSGPGRSSRKGLTWEQLFELIPNEDAAREWWIASRWPHGITCPKCGSIDIQHRASGKPQPYRCRDCRNDFSPKTGSLMQGSPLPYRTWVIAIYILTTGIKGTSSMKLHRDLGITQKSAWFLAHRLREGWAESAGAPFTGPVEADETRIGGKAKNMHRKKWRELSTGTNPDGTSKGQMSHLATVAGMKDRKTRRVRAKVVERASRRELVGHLNAGMEPGTLVYTDELASYQSLPNHETVQHGIGQYVDGQAHVNGMESFWALLKRGYHGTFHRMSPKHLQRYVGEFAGRQNHRPLDTIEQMREIARSADGKRLTYRTLTRGCGRQRMAE